MILDYINPVKIYKEVQATLREAFNYWTYIRVVNSLKKSGEFEKVNLRVTELGKAYYVLNLQPELLIYEKEGFTELQKLEMTKVKDSLIQYNEFYINHRLIDYVKTGFDRIRDKDYYGYLVWIDFAYFYLQRENLTRTAVTLFSNLIAYCLIIGALIYKFS